MDGLKNEGHRSYVQRLEQQQGFQGVGKVGDWCLVVGSMVVAEMEVWELLGRRSVLALALVVKARIDEEEKETE